jgi:hypothetical protein
MTPLITKKDATLPPYMIPFTKNGLFLSGNCMLISRCCNDDLYVNNHLYFCKKCQYDCDTIFVKDANKDVNDDTGRTSQAEEPTCPT